MLHFNLDANVWSKQVNKTVSKDRGACMEWDIPFDRYVT